MPDRKDKTLDELTKEGWYLDPLNKDLSNTGSPQTVEERKAVADFILANGRLPVASETSSFQRGNVNYAPGSTMYELGYRTYEDYQRSGNKVADYGNWGPYAGKDVPTFGTTVLTDESGRPLKRRSGAGGFDTEAQGYLQKGQYISNPNDKSLNFQGMPQGFTGNAPMGEEQPNYYNRYTPPVQTPEYKAMDKAEYLAKLKGQKPAEYYQEQVRQYLANKANEEGFQVEDLNMQLAGLDQQIAELNEQEKSRNEYTQAKNEQRIAQLKEALKGKLTPEDEAKATAELKALQYPEAPQYEPSPGAEYEVFDQKTGRTYSANKPLSMQRQELQRQRDALQSQLEAFLTYDPSEKVAQRVASLREQLSKAKDPAEIERINNQLALLAVENKGSKADQVLAYIENWLSKGMPLENTMARVKDLYNLSNEDLKEIKPTAEMMEDLNKVNEESYSQWFEQREFNKQENIKNAPTSPLFGGGGEAGYLELNRQEAMIRGTKKPDYMEFVKGMRVSPNSQAWLLDNYQYFVQMWQQKGMRMPFMDFLTQYLANGGMAEYESLPASARGENPKRFAPMVVNR